MSKHLEPGEVLAQARGMLSCTSAPNAGTIRQLRETLTELWLMPRHSVSYEHATAFANVLNVAEALRKALDEAHRQFVPR